MSVIDASAIRQLIVQISYWRQQIQAMSGQLAQLQRTHAALTGSRGIENLLPELTQAHDYLPADYASLRDAVQGLRADYQALGSAARAALAANEVLDAPRMARLGAAERELMEQARRGSALWQVASEGAYRQSGERFAQLERLLAAIGSAGDAKAIADLQGRIAAEQAMLANEQLQFQALAQRALAEQAVHAQRLREQTVQQHGEFGRRFEPTLP
jgi:type IV secretion system protein VirB5